jgi:hypothetical protein
VSRPAAARVTLLGVALLAMLGAPAGAGAAAPAVGLGFSDLPTMQRGDVAQRPLELQHLRSTGARTLRVMWRWSDVEKTRPADDGAATDPGYAGYTFTALDALLRDIAAAGVEPLLMINSAPSWWEGAERPPVSDNARAGTWKPDPAAYRRFMTAAAKRYSGTYPDPLNFGAVLPRVRNWQIWNEPNLDVELTPQWTKVNGRWTTTSPGLYRALLAAGYDGVKAGMASDTVVTAGTAPYGDPFAGGKRIMPARFLREVLCVTGRARLVAHNCNKTPAKFDVLAHHPYPIGPPGRHARNADDAVVPDFAKLEGPLKVALAAGNIFPKTKSKPIWATEMSWDSNPPDPGGIEVQLQARYLAGAMYVLWRQGVSRLYWWNLRDDAPTGKGDYTTSLQSGVFYRGATVAQDTPKPAFVAARFPFVGYRKYSDFQGHGDTLLWGLAPAGGRSVSLQTLSATKWTTFKKVKANADHVFHVRVKAKRGQRYRAVQAKTISIDTKVF